MTEIEMFERIGKLKEQNDALAKAVREYLSECDNPVPDYSHRVHLRQHMRDELARQS